tara:strand:- start:370 stop:861 length:492 start_codon:yes stop_codon:yes gene_type:complete
MGEFNYRVTEGPVVASPFKYDTGVRVGDTLYFHHLVVMQGGQVLTGVDDHYIVKYNPEAISNQAIAYKCQDTGEIKPLTGWSLLEPVEEEDKTKSDVIEIVQLKEKLPTKGRVAFTSSGIEEIGLKVGDIVGFKENRDYRIKIDGKEYYRTRIEDLLYVENDG